MIIQLCFKIYVLSILLVSRSKADVPTIDKTPPSSVVIITKDNYTKITSSKTVFLKLFSPKCAHCQSLAPAWEEMAQKCNAKHEHMVVGEIDCASDSVQNQWCHSNFQLSGLPTMLYGEPSLEGVHLEEYAGDRSASGLSRFCHQIAKNGPICTASNLQACDTKTNKDYETYWGWSGEQLDTAIKEHENDLKTLEQQYQELFEELHNNYNAAASKRQSNFAERKANIRILKEIKNTIESR
mmetsp:Transcript_3081/g.4153  ORF Transcript_3081/g.4153 Transcript_3081/m.4153 type:complete len:240 (-) Transcript_3081:59-778(-)|eukprot:CAMPEP_0198153910 /NCGR_PEP_ID=MMETSP1443-20131203/66335_1 /TAXON_ID=186043 /ORGANISM="Entomoneis sp., Strain CCMP2396" /LENGTH=239 /DNA_ID=CAMNT_0043820425 /DNA_START=16 /DNA_END=735 /DNA_ORIENTATION=-